jgi:hypothetical protein
MGFKEFIAELGSDSIVNFFIFPTSYRVEKVSWICKSIGKEFRQESAAAQSASRSTMRPGQSLMASSRPDVAAKARA